MAFIANADITGGDDWTGGTLGRSTTGTTTRIGPNEIPVHGPDISADGNFVVFPAIARPGAAALSAPMSVYRYDRKANRSVLAMVTPPDDAFYGSEECDISDDGFFVATETKSATLVEDDTNGQFDVFRTEVSSPVRSGPVISPTTRSR